MAEAIRSLGTQLLLGSAETAVAGLTSISGIESTAETIDVTTLDSDGGYREFLASFKDGGEVGVEGFFINQSGNGQDTLYALHASGETETCKIKFPNGAYWSFKGKVTKFATSASLEDAITFSGTIKVIGAPTLTIA